MLEPGDSMKLFLAALVFLAILIILAVVAAPPSKKGDGFVDDATCGPGYYCASGDPLRMCFDRKDCKKCPPPPVKPANAGVACPNGSVLSPGGPDPCGRADVWCADKPYMTCENGQCVQSHGDFCPNADPTAPVWIGKKNYCAPGYYCHKPLIGTNKCVKQ